MNIVKLKDIIKPDDDFFNKYLKGKYAWWVHMRYIIPFDLMGVQGYIACEEDINDLFKPPFKAEFRDTYDREMWKYIDQQSTDIANCINTYKSRNKYSPDSDITAEEVKQFRTWLASELLKFDQNIKDEQVNNIFTSKQTTVLLYYKNLMYDEVIKKLNEFSDSGNMIVSTNLSCGCSNSTDLSSLYNISSADPIAIYRKSIYNEMVDMFSEIEFWEQFSEEFLNEFQKYVDNVINMNLPLQLMETNKCSCASINSTQNYNQDILKRLSISLDYIKNRQTAGHKNYITDALYDWASKLYELMQW